MPSPPVVSFTRRQRWVALVYGLGCHALFLASVAAMFVSLYQGLRFSLVHLHGAAAVAGDGLLILQFALGHSFLLSDRGRRWMSHLAPLGLGRQLSTTIFAALASLQLLLTFLFWSSSDILWAAPDGALRLFLSILYGLSWLLLAKSMADAGLDVQIGTLGWLSVWRGRRPVYQPFTRAGMFRHTRQPIYSAFTLVLWTAPDWTPDHLVLAVAWSAYCLAAPVWKERRYLRYYGDAYARYQSRVPYWFPRMRRLSMNKTTPALPQTDAPSPPGGGGDCEVLIIGAGPVGLALACLLGARGTRVLVLERREELPAQSQAIGITPPSLEILAALGLDQEFVKQGLPLRGCHVHGYSGYLGRVSFENLPGAHRYILSLPQKVTMQLLEQKLATFPTVALLRGLAVVSVTQSDAGVEVQTEDRLCRAAWLAACDGAHSQVRDLLRMRTRRRDYGRHFVMGDFVDHSSLGQEAHLYFTPLGAVESFPLPGGLRRWIVQTPAPAGGLDMGCISQAVRERTGLILAPGDQINQSPFSPWRLDCEELHDGRVILCGDAAHVMSPIGGQGMNTGFADAEYAAAMLHAILSGGQDPAGWLADYDRCRRKAARTAATRAALGMGLGTWRGVFPSLLRDAILAALFRGPLAPSVGTWFAMKSLPFNRMAASTFATRRLRAVDRCG